MPHRRVINGLAIVLLIAGGAYFYFAQEPRVEPLRFDTVARGKGGLVLHLTYLGSRAGKLDPSEPGVYTRMQFFECDKPGGLEHSSDYPSEVRLLRRGTGGRAAPYGTVISVKGVSCGRKARVWSGSGYVEAPPVDWNNTCLSYVSPRRHPLEITRIRAATVQGALAPVGAFCDQIEPVDSPKTATVTASPAG